VQEVQLHGVLRQVVRGLGLLRQAQAPRVQGQQLEELRQVLGAAQLQQQAVEGQ
jgi:hypothetical protein